MAGARDHLDPSADGLSAAVPRRASDHGHAPALAGRADPRLAHGGAADGLLRLQRTAGNAAVASLVSPVVQREVRIDEVESTVSGPSATGPATGPAAPGAAGGATDGATPATGPTTITGSQITLDAPITESPGIIRADTVIANSVVADNYSPGAGNVW